MGAEFIPCRAQGKAGRAFRKYCLRPRLPLLSENHSGGRRGQMGASGAEGRAGPRPPSSLLLRLREVRVETPDRAERRVAAIPVLRHAVQEVVRVAVADRVQRVSGALVLAQQVVPQVARADALSPLPAPLSHPLSVWPQPISLLPKLLVSLALYAYVCLTCLRPLYHPLLNPSLTSLTPLNTLPTLLLKLTLGAGERSEREGWGGLGGKKRELRGSGSPTG